jgi:hypothetical protein
VKVRVVGAVDAWLGRYVESMLAADIGNLLEDSAVQLGDIVAEYVAKFDARLASAIAVSTSARDRRRLGVTPDEIAAVLHTLGQGCKYQVDSRTEFVAKLTAAVRLVFAGFTIARK